MTIQDMVSNMPRNRGLHDRDAKRADIVGVAREMFVSDGFERTSISRLAKAVGITPNTLYWYFKDKDDILVAVLALIAAEEVIIPAAIRAVVIIKERVFIEVARRGGAKERVFVEPTAAARAAKERVLFEVGAAARGVATPAPHHADVEHGGFHDGADIQPVLLGYAGVGDAP